MAEHFRLGGIYSMNNDDDQLAIDNLVKDVGRLYSTGNGAPGTTTLGYLYADVENQKLYAKSGDSWIEVGNV